MSTLYGFKENGTKQEMVSNLNNGTGANSIKQPATTEASGVNSAAFGVNTTASGSASFAAGSGATASGTGSHAEGNGTASAAYAHAEGSSTNAKGPKSHAEGGGTQASGEFAHSEGEYTQAYGKASHAEGESTRAGYSSNAEIGIGAHAEGSNTEARANYSHAEGNNTLALSESQHVQGKYNIYDINNKYAHIVGNGDATTPSNMHTIDWNGTAWFANGVQVGGAAQDDENAKTLAVAYDGLDSTSTVDALSANQGKALKTEIDELWHHTNGVKHFLMTNNLTAPDQWWRILHLPLEYTGFITIIMPNYDGRMHVFMLKIAYAYGSPILTCETSTAFAGKMFSNARICYTQGGHGYLEIQITDGSIGKTIDITCLGGVVGSSFAAVNEEGSDTDLATISVSLV